MLCTFYLMPLSGSSATQHIPWRMWLRMLTRGRGQLKCDGTRAETRFHLSAKRTSPFKSAGASIQSTADSRGVRISGSNAVYTMFRGSVNGTGYPLHSPVSPSLPLPCLTVCHHIATGVYRDFEKAWNEASVPCREVLCRHLDGAKVEGTVTVHTLC
jgi:hypothetical protein